MPAPQLRQGRTQFYEARDDAQAFADRHRVPVAVYRDDGKGRTKGVFVLTASDHSPEPRTQYTYIATVQPSTAAKPQRRTK